MNYEVMKVANGYIVRPGYAWQRNGHTESEQQFVFRTVDEVADWLAIKFGEVDPKAGVPA